MYQFVCYPTGNRYPITELHGAYAVGADGVPVRANLHYNNATGVIRCEPRSQEAIGLSLLWPVEGYGAVQLETTRLPAREQPYHLHVELARHRLMRLNLKREEWGLFDYSGLEEITAQIDKARDRFVEALAKLEDPPAAARLADEALALSLAASDRITKFHAGVFLTRRQQGGGFARNFLGACAPSQPPKPDWPRRLVETFDFVRIPLVWRDIRPKEQGAQYETVDALVKACAAAKLPMRGGPLLNFGVRAVPDWTYIWENDYDNLLEYAREHVRTTVQRYAGQIGQWIVASGLHADNVFSFNFEQIIELTRMAATVTKQIAPRSAILLDLTQPWGEYYVRNSRTIPPPLYADMAVQSGVQFDAFGLQFLFGLDSDGYYLRDALQISSLLDRLANLGKPLHVTAVAVPSAQSGAANAHNTHGGQWHGPWSDQTQADWLVEFCEVVLSKPFVESVCLQVAADGPNDEIPFSGVYREDLTPKPAVARLGEMRKRLQGEAGR